MDTKEKIFCLYIVIDAEKLSKLINKKILKNKTEQKKYISNTNINSKIN